MAARDLSVEVREFVVSSMAAAASIASLTGAAVYGPSVPKEPTWPFIRVDLPVVNPDHDAGCGLGSRYTYNVHGFARGDDERNAARLGSAISGVLDELAGAITESGDAEITDTVWTATQVFKDIAEPDGWHAVVSVYSRVSG